MNTAIPFPLAVPASKPGVLRDPVACLRSFLAKVKALALKRGDHGSALEHNVLGKFVEREAALRTEAAADAISAAEADDRALQALDDALVDGVVDQSDLERLRLARKYIRASARCDRSLVEKLKL